MAINLEGEFQSVVIRAITALDERVAALEAARSENPQSAEGSGGVKSGPKGDGTPAAVQSTVAQQDSAKGAQGQK